MDSLKCSSPACLLGSSGLEVCAAPQVEPQMSQGPRLSASERSCSFAPFYVQAGERQGPHMPRNFRFLWLVTGSWISAYLSCPTSDLCSCWVFESGSVASRRLYHGRRRFMGAGNRERFRRCYSKGPVLGARFDLQDIPPAPALSRSIEPP